MEKRVHCFSSLAQIVGQRRAFTIVELVATFLLLAAMFSVTIPMLLVVARERRSTEQRQFALQHLENLLEHAQARPPSELEIGELKLPDANSDLIAILPGLERKLALRQVPGEPGQLQLVASIHWQGLSGQPAAPIQLVAWILPKRETQ